MRTEEVSLIVDEMHDAFGIVAGEDQTILGNGLRQGCWACLGRNVQFASADEADCFLNGCATKPLPSAVSCPEPVSILAHLAEPSLPSARAYSQEVRSYLSEVQTSLRKWRQIKMPSSN